MKNQAPPQHTLPVKILITACIALPVIAYLLNVYGWLRYGIDIPLYDDWRTYRSNDMGRLDLGYLLTPSNDTLYSTGLLLDSLWFKLFDGNSLLYQFASMAMVLGALLHYQWKLIRRHAKNILIAAIAFCTSISMLQPDSYWGWQNLAYHQALPLVATLFTLDKITDYKNNGKYSLALIFIITFLSGFSYISGAFASMALLICVVAFRFCSPISRRKTLDLQALAIAPGAIISTAAQLWVIIGVQHGTHRADAPMAFPWESDFWFFMLGKVGRSLLIPALPQQTYFAALATVLICSLLIGTFLYALMQVYLKGRSEVCTQQFTMITLCIVTFTYLLLISAGRTNLRPEEVNSFLDIFAYGFYRFHFFWITLLWPWLVLQLINRRVEISRLKIFACGTLILICIAFSAPYTGTFKQLEFYKQNMAHRKQGLDCLAAAIQSPDPIKCSQLDLGDLQNEVSNGIAANASFARSLPMLPISIEAEEPQPAYRLSTAPGNKEIAHATVARNAESHDLNLITQADPMILFNADATKMAKCGSAEVYVRQKNESDSIAQLFYTPTNSSGFSEQNAISQPAPSSDTPQTLIFRIQSAAGFAPQFRFDPVTDAQTVNITDVVVRCRQNLKDDR